MATSASRVWPTILLVAGGLIATASFFVPFFYITAHAGFYADLFWCYAESWLFWWGQALGCATLAIIIFLLVGGTATRAGKWIFLALAIGFLFFAAAGITRTYTHAGLEDVRLWPRNGPRIALAEIHPYKVNVFPLGAAGEIVAGSLWIVGGFILLRRPD